MAIPAAAGIDAGKAFLDVAFAPKTTSFRVANSTAGINAILARLRKAGIGHVVLEAIGTYAAPLVRALARRGFAVSVVNPRRIKAFREAEGKRAKTDRLDAALIARFALAMSDAIHPMPSQDQLAVKALATRRRQLVEMIAIEKTRLKQAPDNRIADSHRAAIASLAVERKRIEAELEARIAGDLQYARKMQILLSIPGIGKQTATTLLTDLPELGSIDRRAIASLAGLAPHIQQSATRPGRAQIGGGRPCVRAALYMAALSAARREPCLRAAYQAMRNDGKPAKVALVAVARRLLIIANALAKTGQAYSPTHYSPD
jgi:transposase